MIIKTQHLSSIISIFLILKMILMNFQIIELLKLQFLFYL